MSGGCRSLLFPLLFIRPLLALFAVAPCLHISTIRFPSQIQLGGLRKRIWIPTLSRRSLPAHVFFATASINFVIRSTMCICHPLKKSWHPQNDGQSQKLWRGPNTLGPQVLKSWTGYAFHASNRMVAALRLCYTHGFLGLFTDTSELIRFYFLLFLFSTFLVVGSGSSLSWLVPAFERTLK